MKIVYFEYSDNIVKAGLMPSKLCYVIGREHDSQMISIAMSGENNPMFGKTHNNLSRKIISEANKQRIVCPHCNKEGGIAIMRRWHFDRCKSKVL